MKFVVRQQLDGRHRGKWSWSLMANNGRGLAMSGSVFETRTSCLDEIKAIRSGCPQATIIEEKPSAVRA